ncbi:MAG: polymer-forming cytoskeletal protein [Myxococcota bacterium]
MTRAAAALRSGPPPGRERAFNFEVEAVVERPSIDRAREVALVPRGGIFEGQLAVVGTTRVDGTVIGSLEGPGDLILGPEARVEGRIECTSVSSRGTVIGPIVVGRRLHLGEGARFEGDLKAPAVEVDGDVVWNGKAQVSR